MRIRGRREDSSCRCVLLQHQPHWCCCPDHSLPLERFGRAAFATALAATWFGDRRAASVKLSPLASTARCQVCIARPEDRARCRSVGSRRARLKQARCRSVGSKRVARHAARPERHAGQLSGWAHSRPPASSAQNGDAFRSQANSGRGSGPRSDSAVRRAGCTGKRMVRRPDVRGHRASRWVAEERRYSWTPG